MTDVALVAFYRVKETWMNPADRDLKRRAGAWNPDEITTNQERFTTHTHMPRRVTNVERGLLNRRGKWGYN